MNTYWRHPTSGPLAGRHLISDRGRIYRSDVAVAVFNQLGKAPRITARLAVRLLASAPDKRRRDLDNLPKGVLDALTHAGVWADDSQIDVLTIQRQPHCQGGALTVEIEAWP